MMAGELLKKEENPACNDDDKRGEWNAKAGEMAR